MENAPGFNNIITHSYPDFLDKISHADWVLTPTRRLATRLNQDLARQQQKHFNVHIISLSGFIDLLWQDYQDAPDSPNVLRLNDWQNQMVWQNIILAECENLLQPAQSARLAMQAWQQLNEWHIKWQDLPEPMYDVQTFMTWCALYEKKCQENAWCDSSQIADYLQYSLSKGKIYLIGFTDIKPHIQALFDQFVKNGVSIETLQYTEKNADIVCSAHQSKQEEITQAALWAKAKLAENHTYPIGIVIPDLAMRWQEVDEVFTRILMPEAIDANQYDKPRAYNISAGEKLNDFPIIEAALFLLAFNKEAMSINTISTLLLTPFIAGGESEQWSRAALDAALKMRGNNAMTSDAFIACPQLYQLITAHQSAPETLLLPSAWSLWFKQQLHSFGWPGERVLNSREYQVVKRFYEFLSEFAMLDHVFEKIPYKKALFIFNQQAKNILFQGESEDKPIQILGHLEAAGLYFHALWVSGLHDENWPAAAKPHPFLPIALQRAQHMPHASAEREYVFAQHLTKSYTEQAKTVVLSYPLQIDDKHCMPSRLITHYPIKTIAFTVAPTMHLPIEMRESWQEEAIPLKTSLSAGSHLLQAQATCPFQAFAKYRLKARSWSPIEPGISALLRGQLVHEALGFFWQVVKSHERLHQLGDTVLNQHLDNAIQKALDKVLKNNKTKSNLIEKNRLNILLQDWIRIEKTREPFTVLAHEQNIEKTLSGITLRMRIDRIDRVNDAIVLIDYKTGQGETIDWQTPQPKYLQLPLYAITYPYTHSVIYAHIKANALQVQISEVIPNWNLYLNQIVEQFVNGTAEVTPIDGEASCEQCDLTLLCRRRELHVG